MIAAARLGVRSVGGRGRGLLLTTRSRSVGRSAAMAGGDSLYKYSALDIDGKETKLSKFEGKVSLVVNVASF